MVTREWLLEKGFSFRVWDGSKSPNGEYSLRNKGHYIFIGYSDLFGWDYNVTNYEQNISVKATRQTSISIDQLNKVLEVCNISQFN